MSARAIIIHGSYGNPHENWIPWLAEDFKKDRVETVVPVFPTPENQTLSSWCNVFNSRVGELCSEDILIGHSTGSLLVLRLLEKSAVQIKAAVLASFFAKPLGNTTFDPLNQSFVADPFDWNTIRAASKNFLLYHGDNDPYVPLHLAQEVADFLGQKLSIVKDGGHLNAASGHLSFPLLLKDLHPILLK